MAAKKTAKKKAPAKKAKIKKSDEVIVTLRPNSETPCTRVYSNFVQVSQTPYDFNLKFCDATPLPGGESSKNKTTHDIPIVGEIAIPFNVMPGLINALTTQYELFLEGVEKKTSGKKATKK